MGIYDTSKSDSGFVNHPLPEGFVPHDGFTAPFYATDEVVEIVNRVDETLRKKGRNRAWLWRDNGHFNASDIVGYKPPQT